MRNTRSGKQNCGITETRALESWWTQFSTLTGYRSTEKNYAKLSKQLKGENVSDDTHNSIFYGDFR